MTSLKPLISCVSCLLTFWLLVEPLTGLTQTKSGLPTRRAPAGTRGNCEATTATKEVRSKPEQLQSLISEVTLVKNSASPTLSWYVPKTKVRTTAELRIVDETDQLLDKTTIALSGRGGVTSYRIPSDKIAKLQPNRDYRWQFTLLCNAKEPSKNPWVEGTLRRVKP